MMKKYLFAFLMMAMVVSVSASICFASENNDGPQSYEEQALIAEMTKPVVLDKEYPQWGFRSHSWITGIGSETIAHNQIIDLATGTVIKESNTKCNYTDPVYDGSNN